jgi:tyrosyl-tRNA synthetase
VPAENTARGSLDPLTQGAIDLITPEELASRVGTGRPLRVKLGIDPTASDIHLGFAVVLRKLRQFQDAGHVAVLILGDFTARIGDPSGRSATRPPLSSEQIDAHARTYVEQVTQILDPDPERLEVRRNSEWLGAMGVEDVLRLTSHATVARMLERNDFANRYRDGVPITITEFLYPLMQGWDSVAVRADVEIGGTDQLFNLLVGRDLQSHEGQLPQIVLTVPLLPGLSGGPKMSKSLGNYVGIAEPPAEQFGKLMSIPDDLLPDYFQYTTGWPQPEIDAAMSELGRGELHPNAAKRMLARTVADLYHGDGAGAAAEAQFDQVFKEHAAPPRDQMTRFVLDRPLPLSKVLAAAGLVNSNREGVRAVEQGGVKVDEAVATEDAVLDPDALDPVIGSIVQVGRRRWALVVPPGN